MFMNTLQPEMGWEALQKQFLEKAKTIVIEWKQKAHLKFKSQENIR